MNLTIDVTTRERQRSLVDTLGIAVAGMSEYWCSMGDYWGSMGYGVCGYRLMGSDGGYRNGGLGIGSGVQSRTLLVSGEAGLGDGVGSSGWDGIGSTCNCTQIR